MKVMFLVIVSGFMVMALGHTKAEPRIRKTKSSAGIDTIDYQTTIQPVLQQHCSPCHFPGGKMYQAMPFDKGETIISHSAGVLKRLGKKKEKGMVEKYIENSFRQ